jgi:S-adenosylmethionine:tRNA ribosyltransferase-isomerase
VRALESSAEQNGGVVTAGEGSTELLIGRARPPRVVDSILSGMHRPGTSHFDLLEGFTDVRRTTGLTQKSYEAAEAEGYLEHEFGDSIFISGRVERAEPRRLDAA